MRDVGRKWIRMLGFGLAGGAVLVAIRRALRVLLIVAGVVSLVPTLGGAEERTGGLLEELVEKVMHRLEAFDREQKGYAESFARLKRNAEKARAEFNRAQDPTLKEQHRADLARFGAELVAAKQRLARSTLKTLGELKGELEDIQANLQRSGRALPHEQVAHFAETTEQVMTSLAHVFDTLQKGATPQEHAELAGLQATLAGEAIRKQADAQAFGPGQSDLTQALRLLDTTYAQLLSLDQALYSRRLNLRRGIILNLVGLAVGPLTNDRPGVGSIANAVYQEIQDVQHLDQLMDGVLQPPKASAVSGPGRVMNSDMQRVLQNLKDGRFKLNPVGRGE